MPPDFENSAVVTEDEFFQNHKRNAYAELNVSNMKRAMGGNISSIHIKAFTPHSWAKMPKGLGNCGQSEKTV